MGNDLFRAGLAVGALLLSSPAQSTGSSQFKNGNDLLADCSSGDEPNGKMTNFVQCISYIIGVVDTYTVVRASNKLPACFPEGVNAKQIKDMVINYLKQNPAQRHLGASTAVVSSIQPMLIMCPGE